MRRTLPPRTPPRAHAVTTWLLACGLAALPTLHAQRATDPRPPTTDSRPADSVRDLTEMLESVRTTYGVPALGGAFLDVDGMRGLGVCGVRMLGRPEPVTEDDLWHLGSCTKAMTATLAARLANASGQARSAEVALDEFVGGFFPTDERRRIDEGWRRTTLRMLLQNRGGAPDTIDEDLWRSLWNERGAPFAQRRRLVRRLLRNPPAYEPGTEYLYSNAGYALAGHLLELRTGERYEESMRQQVFEPLGMTSAGFGAPGTPDTLDQPRGHRATPGPDGETTYAPVRPGPKADNPAAIAPAGRVHASLRDWARFANAHLTGARGDDVPAFLDASAFARLHEPAQQNYACGWIVVERPWADGIALTHGGSNTMWYAVVWIAPSKGLALLATCNAGGEAASQACDTAIAAMLQLATED